MLTSILMGVGAVGSMLPIFGRRAAGGRVRLAHITMVVVMGAMLVFGMSPWVAVPSSIVMAAAAFYITSEAAGTVRTVPCAVDLVAMTVLLLLIPTASSRASVPAHSHGGNPDPRLGAVLVLACWAALTLYNLERGSSDRRAAVGSALMVVGMVPAAV